MKLFHILVASCLTVFLFFILQAIWGPAGANSCAEMNLYKARLEISIEQLNDFQVQLNSDLARLESDEARLRQEAYRIGLVGANEVRIRIPFQATETIVAPGNIAQKPQDSNKVQALISGISISFGLVMLLLMGFINFEVGLIGGKPNKRRLTENYQGVRVHTASLE